MPCRDAGATLLTQLEALSRQATAATWELVVVDNGSRDGSMELVDSFRDRLPSLRVVQGGAVPSRSESRNVGVRAAAGDRILFCDADDEVAPGWLNAMSAALDEHGLVAARLDVQRLNEAWTIRYRPAHDGLYRIEGTFLPYTFTAALGVRKDVHDAVGGFDEHVPVAEDRDYCYRIQLAGTPLVLVEDAVVHYRYRCSAWEMFRQAREYGMGHAHMYSRYRALGLGRRPLWRAAASWSLLLPRLLVALPDARTRAQWLYRTGDLVGRVEGSVRYGTLIL
jgi:GT2 family glycosyltransferase